MMTRTSPADPRYTELSTRPVVAPPPRSRRRLRLVLLTLATLGALGLLGATVAVYLARGAIVAKAEAMASGVGLRVAIAEVDVPLVGGIGLRDVRVWSADGVEVAHLARVETDVSLLGAALGARRPGRVTLAGGEVTLRWADGFADLRRPESDASAAASGPTEPITLAVEDLAVTIEARHTTPLGVVRADPVRLEGVRAEVRRDAQRHVTAELGGTFVTASHRSPLKAEVDVAAGRVALEASEGVEVALDTPLGPMWLALNGASRAPGAPTEARGLGVRRGDDLVQVGALALEGGGEGLVPDVASLTVARATDIRVKRGDVAATIVSARVTLVATALGPMPREVALSGVEGKAARDGRELSGSVGALEVALADIAEHLKAGTPLEAVTALKLERPAAKLVLAARPEPAEATPSGEGGAPSKPPAPSDGPEPGADGQEPPPFLGNDDDLPPPESVVPALAPGRDWLAALLGSDDGDADAASLGLPPEIAARLPGLLARVGALAPKISDGSLAVVDGGGKVLLALEGAGLAAGRIEGGVGLELRAAVLRDGKEAGRADLRVKVLDDLTLDALEGTVSGRSLAHQLARFVSGLSVQEDAEVDLEIRYERPRAADAPHHVQGTLRLASFSFEFWRIADREIRDLEAKVAFEASIDRKAHRLLLSLPQIEVGQAKLAASLDLTRKKKKRPSFVARLSMARQDCGAVARSVPKGLIPNLPTLALRGKASFDASLTLDLDNPRDLELDVKGDVDDCEVLSLGPQIDLAALRGAFVHHPREPKRGVLEHIAVGRGTPEWVPSEKIPDIVKAAAWVTEDRAWTLHKGVRWELVERALKIDLDHGRFIYGGSTITQQLVKNLYLTRDKNLARKFEEAIIAWQMERVLSKDEILTIYINCIEYGPDIYGIKQAARVYFGKRPNELDALESAFIMGLKPYPKAGYNQFLKGQLDVWWVRRVSHVLRYMAKFAPDQITLEEAEAFDPWQPAFRKP